jgi:hypothetical protein
MGRALSLWVASPGDDGRAVGVEVDRECATGAAGSSAVALKVAAATIAATMI